MPSNSDQGKRTIGAFDIRFVIGALLGVYGLILILLGLFNATQAQLKRGDGLNINLWAGHSPLGRFGDPWSFRCGRKSPRRPRTERAGTAGTSAVKPKARLR